MTSCSNFVNSIVFSTVVDSWICGASTGMAPRESAALSAATSCDHTMPFTGPPFGTKFVFPLECRGCINSISHGFSDSVETLTPNRPQKSTNSASGVMNGIRVLFFTLLPLQVIIN